MKLQDIINEDFYQDCINKTWKEVKEKIENIASLYHSPQLININSAPNDNIIYMIWNDGEISEEKGSWTFGQRNVRTFQTSLTFRLNLFQFPFIRGNFSGIILSKEDCIHFRNFLEKILIHFKIH